MNGETVTEEMVIRYFNRTMKHIHRVQNLALYLVTACWIDLDLSIEERRKLIHNVLNHDRSKFSQTQMFGYIFLTEFHHQRRNGNPDYQYPEGIDLVVKDAINDHYLRENHHPDKCEMDRTFAYGKLESIETMCDLQAMADEFGEGSCRSYFEDVWLPRVIEKSLLSENQLYFFKKVAYKVIDCFEKPRLADVEC